MLCMCAIIVGWLFRVQQPFETQSTSNLSPDREEEIYKQKNSKTFLHVKVGRNCTFIGLKSSHYYYSNLIGHSVSLLVYIPRSRFHTRYGVSP